MTKMTTTPSLYYVATGCIHPEETYDQCIHVIGSHQYQCYSPEDIRNYLDQDIAWRVSLNCKERHLPSRKYVATGELYEDEPFDPTIHKPDNRNVRAIYTNKTLYFYEDYHQPSVVDIIGKLAKFIACLDVSTSANDLLEYFMNNQKTLCFSHSEIEYLSACFRVNLREDQQMAQFLLSLAIAAHDGLEEYEYAYLSHVMPDQLEMETLNMFIEAYSNTRKNEMPPPPPPPNR